MRRYQPLQPYDEDSEPAEINLAPMLDILFILLIFFLVTTSFVRESGIQVERPAASSAQAAEASSIMLAIAADGEIWLDGDSVDLRRLKQPLSRLHALTPEAPVVIQADRKADVGLLVRVMDQVRLAGIQDIAIAAETP
ncbi:MAG: biopolymer transporter ExbD [gamma proteobacterium symbiont of Bathyaustriella thionipta]|nr:biopolymer transporter ExbD [gamma proteobacterium symbiont of Bathyaustriella thionipta]